MNKMIMEEIQIHLLQIKVFPWKGAIAWLKITVISMKPWRTLMEKRQNQERNELKQTMELN
jgi:hypothetical protein